MFLIRPGWSGLAGLMFFFSVNPRIHCIYFDEFEPCRIVRSPRRQVDAPRSSPPAGLVVERPRCSRIQACHRAHALLGFIYFARRSHARREQRLAEIVSR